MHPELTQAATVLRTARRVAVLTGAGISAESGVPTFRDAMTGLWARFRPEELATPEAFARDPQLIWDWYRWRRELVDRAEPNEGHRALVRLEDQVSRAGGSFTLISQNVDGLHIRAGSRSLLELHGSLARARCPHDATVTFWTPETNFPPMCPSCSNLMRPDVVWFGEALPQRELEGAVRAARNAEVFISVGTSNFVQPAASLPWVSHDAGAHVMVVNTDMVGQRKGMGITHLAGSAGMILPVLLQETWGSNLA